jgi:Spy/CpxP family protein refolding chaperone
MRKTNRNNSYRDSRLKMIQLKSALEVERFELETMVDKGTLDEAAILKQCDALEGARASLARERFGFFLTFRKILGQEKFQRLMQIKKTRDRKKLKG